MPARSALASMLLVVLVVLLRCAVADAASGTGDTSLFVVVVYMCTWKRPLLTDFVLAHYDKLREPLSREGVQLDIFITGSEGNVTEMQARKYKAQYAVHPNSPLGAKHDKGIQSLRDFYRSAEKNGQIPRLPDAVTIVGSDDMINAAFFTRIRDQMSGPPPLRHVVGLKDIYFFDLKSRRLVYTRGYRYYETPISGTLGCGRAFSWSMLEMLHWHLWDVDRERGLDQSAIRNVMMRVPLVGEVSMAIDGREAGIMAVDMKSDGFAAGMNIWRFEQVVEAVGRNGRLHEFEDYDADATLGAAFETQFLTELEELRSQLAHSESE